MMGRAQQIFMWHQIPHVGQEAPERPEIRRGEFGVADGGRSVPKRWIGGRDSARPKPRKNDVIDSKTRTRPPTPVDATQKRRGREMNDLRPTCAASCAAPPPSACARYV